MEKLIHDVAVPLIDLPGISNLEVAEKLFVFQRICVLYMEVTNVLAKRQKHDQCLCTVMQAIHQLQYILGIVNELEKGGIANGLEQQQQTQIMLTLPSLRITNLKQNVHDDQVAHYPIMAESIDQLFADYYQLPYVQSKITFIELLLRLQSTVIVDFYYWIQNSLHSVMVAKQSTIIAGHGLIEPISIFLQCYYHLLIVTFAWTKIERRNEFDDRYRTITTNEILNYQKEMIIGTLQVIYSVTDRGKTTPYTIPPPSPLAGVLEIIKRKKQADVGDVENQKSKDNAGYVIKEQFMSDALKLHQRQMMMNYAKLIELSSLYEMNLGSNAEVESSMIEQNLIFSRLGDLVHPKRFFKNYKNSYSQTEKSSIARLFKELVNVKKKKREIRQYERNSIIYVSTHPIDKQSAFQQLIYYQANHLWLPTKGMLKNVSLSDCYDEKYITDLNFQETIVPTPYKQYRIGVETVNYVTGLREILLNIWPEVIAKLQKDPNANLNYTIHELIHNHFPKNQKQIIQSAESLLKKFKVQPYETNKNPSQAAQFYSLMIPKTIAKERLNEIERIQKQLFSGLTGVLRQRIQAQKNFLKRIKDVGSNTRKFHEMLDQWSNISALNFESLKKQLIDKYVENSKKNTDQVKLFEDVLVKMKSQMQRQAALLARLQNQKDVEQLKEKRQADAKVITLMEAESPQTPTRQEIIKWIGQMKRKEFKFNDVDQNYLIGAIEALMSVKGGAHKVVGKMLELFALKDENNAQYLIRLLEQMEPQKDLGDVPREVFDYLKRIGFLNLVRTITTRIKNNESLIKFYEANNNPANSFYKSQNMTLRRMLEQTAQQISKILFPLQIKEKLFKVQKAFSERQFADWLKSVQWRGHDKIIMGKVEKQLLTLQNKWVKGYLQSTDNRELIERLRYSFNREKDVLQTDLNAYMNLYYSQVLQNQKVQRFKEKEKAYFQCIVKYYSNTLVRMIKQNATFTLVLHHLRPLAQKMLGSEAHLIIDKLESNYNKMIVTHKDHFVKCNQIIKEQFEMKSIVNEIIKEFMDIKDPLIIKEVSQIIKGLQKKIEQLEKQLKDRKG